MTASPEFEFVSAAACRDQKVGNYPEVATNVRGVVVFRDSERPDTVVTMTPEVWAVRVAGIRLYGPNLKRTTALIRGRLKMCGEFREDRFLGVFRCCGETGVRGGPPGWCCDLALTYVAPLCGVQRRSTGKKSQLGGHDRIRTGVNRFAGGPLNHSGTRP